MSAYRGWEVYHRPDMHATGPGRAYKAGMTLSAGTRWQGTRGMLGLGIWKP